MVAPSVISAHTRIAEAVAASFFSASQGKVARNRAYRHKLRGLYIELAAEAGALRSGASNVGFSRLRALEQALHELRVRDEQIQVSKPCFLFMSYRFLSHPSSHAAAFIHASCCRR